MKMYECKKVENCFSGTHIYEYRLPFKVKEEIIECFGAFGSIKYHKNFPRPCFQVVTKSGTTIKGVITDNVIKVSFPTGNPQESKEHFELFLEELLRNQMADGER